MKKFSEDTFTNDISQGTTLVDFYADWCGPCRMMTPILEQLSQEMHGSVTIGKIDVDHAQKIASSYQVTSIPTLILFQNGKEMGRVVGLRDAASLKEFIAKTSK